MRGALKCIFVQSSVFPRMHTKISDMISHKDFKVALAVELSLHVSLWSSMHFLSHYASSAYRKNFCMSVYVFSSPETLGSQAYSIPMLRRRCRSHFSIIFFSETSWPFKFHVEHP